MSHTNSTTNYGFPQFLGTDKPTWLGDVNTAYADIDRQMKVNADAAATADTKATAAAGAVSDLTPRVSDLESNVDGLADEISNLNGNITELASELRKDAFITTNDEFYFEGAVGWLTGDKKIARFYLDLPKPSHNRVTLPTYSLANLSILIAASDGHIDGNTQKNYINEPGYNVTVRPSGNSQVLVTITKKTAFNATYGNCPIFAHGTLSFEVQTAS